MDYSGIAYSALVLGSLNVINLAYFLVISRTDRQYWTIVNIQLLTLILGYILYYYTTAYCFFHRENNGKILDASSTAKDSYVVSFFFIAVAESAYLYHSWMRAKMILYYKNKVWYSILDIVLKVSCVITFVPVPFEALALNYKSEYLISLALLLTGLVGLIVFVFDCFIIYSFTKYFFFSKDKAVTGIRKNGLIAKYGTVASFAVLCTSFFQIAMSGFNLDIATQNALLVCVFVFFQIPTWVFVGLKVALKTDAVESSPDSKTGIVKSDI